MPTHHPFPATRWSVVLSAGQGGRQALETLCTGAWLPLYAFARRRGLAPAEAEDAVQAFLAALLEREALGRADPARGRFRTFLLRAFTNHLNDAWDATRAAKRGGGRVVQGGSEARWAAEISAVSVDLPPEAEFDRRWAFDLLDASRRDLETSYAAAGKGALFAALAPGLEGGAPDPAVLTALGLSEGAAKVALHRLRSRWRDAMRAQVADTLEPGESVDDEIAHLLAAVQGCNR